MSAPPYPWVYSYQEDGPRLDAVVLRPVVPITLVADDVAPTSLSLVDSGCEHVLAAPWLAYAVGVDPSRGHRSITLGIGGENLTVQFIDLSLRLQAPNSADDDYVEWQAEVGFLSHWRPTWPILVGQMGFLNRFTVTMNRQAQRLAVEDWDAFDRRFGVHFPP